MIPDKDKLYFSTLSNLREEELEELVNMLEKEAERYLERILPPKTDYSIVISIVRKSNQIDVILDIAVRGNIVYSRDFSSIISETVKHVKEKLIETLESKLEK